MIPCPVSNKSEFDRYAEEYNSALARGISVSGEARDYFARGRTNWLKRCLHKAGVEVKQVLDYGCGTGSTAPHLLALGAERVLGVDVSERSLEVARREQTAGAVEFLEVANYQPAGEMDLVFCNGVFHHIPVEERATAMDMIYKSLRPGGWLAFWENNPWNPGTQWIMRRIPFDRLAVKVSAPQGRRLVSRAGLVVMRTDFLFIFPRVLKWLRMLEPALSALPFGAQYQILARKEASR